MIISYAFKRVIRSWKLFAALFLGVVLSATLFAGINVGADTSAKQALDQQLSTIVVDAYASGGRLSPQNLSSAAVLFSSFGSVKKTEIISRLNVGLQIKNETKLVYFNIAGIEKGSKVYDGLTVMDGSIALEANETYVVRGSKDQDKLALGDNATFKIPMSFTTYSTQIDPYGRPIGVVTSSNTVFLNVTLKVTGLVQLTEQALSIALRRQASIMYGTTTPSSSVQYDYNLLLVDWWETIAPIIDFIYAKSQSTPFSTEMAIYLDREALIDPWDIPSSQLRINTLISQMNNKASALGMRVSNNILSALSQYQYIASSIMFTSLITALPVFFIAWYMTMTISNVIFNLRRREIGLLLTKGLSKGQLLRTFLSEALTVGLLGGVAGVGLSLLLTPLFVGAFGGKFGTPVIGWSSLILTVSFSVGVTFLAIFQPARKASSLKAIDALREYLFVQEERAYRKKLSWAAFILGTYKIIALAIGFSIPTSPPTGMYGNIIVMILYVVSFTLDNVLNYIGPLLFFWGFTKIFIIGSLKFQSLTSKATRRFLGGLSVMAAKNVERSPARVAAIAFLVALIVGHGVSVIGSLASQQDYTVRSAYFSVGSDLSVTLFSTVNASQKMAQVAELSEVSATTLEYSFYVTQMGAISGTFRLIAVEPQEWLHIAYYDDDWFNGRSAADAFQAMASDNDTIILDRNIGQYLKLTIDDYVSFYLSNGTVCRLKVVGFFGSVNTQNIAGIGVMSPSSSRLWSYVPNGFLEEISNPMSPQAKVLVKLDDIRYGESTQNEILSFSPRIGSVSNVYTMLNTLQTNALLISNMNVQRIGVAFAIIAASIGTVLVVLASLNERKKEICMMSVRGLSFRQITSTLFAEDLVVVLFAVLLGLASGLIILRGSLALASSQTVSSNPLLTRRIVFPLDSVLILSASLALIFASVIVPVLFVLSRYLTQLDKVVRQT